MKPPVPDFSEVVELWKAGRTAAATRAAQSLVAVYPANGRAHTLLGILADVTARLIDAQRSFRRSVVIDPRDGEAWRNFGGFLLGRDERHQAIIAFLNSYILGLRDADAILAIMRDSITTKTAITLTSQRLTAAGLLREQFNLHPDLRMAHEALYVEAIALRPHLPEDGVTPTDL